MKKRVFAMLMAAVMAFSLVACGNKTDNGGGDAADTAETIKLGGVGPLTGGYANYGLSVQHGAELAVSCITNMATGIQTVKHSHARVLEIANRAGDTMCRWLGAVIQKM